MRIAILIQCHKNPKQINLLLERLNHPDIDCYLHIDKKADFADKIIHRENVFVLPDEQRVSVEWAQISQVTATLNLLNTAVTGIRGGYDYYWLISGQDWPLRSADEIVKFFEKHSGVNFIQYWDSKNHGNHKQNNLDKRNQIYFPIKFIGPKPWQKIIKRGWVELTGGYNRTWKIFERKQLGVDFYFGSQWWALTGETVEWIINYLGQHEDYYIFYKNTVCPDESFFQTLVMRSPYADKKTDYLTYLHFSEGANSPDILRASDFPQAKESGCLVMRKVDMDVDDFFVSR